MNVTNRQGEQDESSATTRVRGRHPRRIHVPLASHSEVLYSHQKTCEKTGKYMEAETAKRRLAKVKEELEKHRKEELLARFQEEKRQVEMAHL